VEMLVAVAIIAFLAGIVISTISRIDTQDKISTTRGAMAILDAALQQFRDSGYRYAYDGSDSEKREFYGSLEFPLDCNDFDQSELCSELEEAMDVTAGAVSSGHEKKYSGCEAMYFILSRVSECRKVLENIDKSLITDKDSNGDSMNITVDSRPYPLVRVLDGWGRTLRYDYYDEEKNDFGKRKKTVRTFPVVSSAGSDGRFDTLDDISSR